jgi:hypothetical protein
MADTQARAADKLIDNYLDSIPDEVRRGRAEEIIFSLLIAGKKGLLVTELLNQVSFLRDGIILMDLEDVISRFATVIEMKDGSVRYYWKYPNPGEDDNMFLEPSARAAMHETLVMVLKTREILERIHGSNYFQIEDAISVVMEELKCTEDEALESVMKCFALFPGDFTVKKQN